MGAYACKLKHERGRRAYATTSSREIILIFANGHRWKIPEMILHYVADHGWLPPAEFIKDLLEVCLDQSLADMTYVNPHAPTFDEKFGIRRIGYLGLEVPNDEVGAISDQAWEKLRHYITCPGKLLGRRFLVSFG